MKIIQVVGARPNFMKVASLHRAFLNYPDVQSLILHTGQHSDPNMSEVFLNQLNLPRPDFFLGVSGGSHLQMMEAIMSEFEKVLDTEKPDLVLVVGDVNSTYACGITASKMKYPLAHVEAGLRSFDKTMPEEVNRIAVDHVSDFLFTTEPSARKNLLTEQIPESRIHFVGNCMIDSLIYYLPRIKHNKIIGQIVNCESPYVLMTMHRPSNVDTMEGLDNILKICQSVSEKIKIVFPVHPRTRSKMDSFGLWPKFNAIDNLMLTEPLGYLEFLGLMKESTAVFTDSGGIQEETTYLKIPCLTFRKTTERPVTIEIGSNVMITDFDIHQTLNHLDQIIEGQWKKSSIPELWDGHAAERITKILVN
jgi:UDP-N-acetylglucosamine 2-epimerase (non-hydrolysing)